ncbi:GNAT family N-acetyltransferase, partial [bacterium]|nr:GNAT family N-acetyltransferase [bacterium]
AGADAFEGGHKSLPSIEIRMATLEDVDDIIDLASEMVKYSRSPFRPVDENVIAEVRRADLQSIYQLLNNKDMVAFVARDHRGRLVGHVLLHIKSGNTDFLTGEELAWVFDISVQPKHWGSGVSRRLLQMAERFAQERGVRYVGLTVTVANGRALRFYQNCGYQEERYQMIKILEPLDMEDDL